MERILKEQFVNLTLILCEFKRDFASEPGYLGEIYNDLNSYVNWSRDTMAKYCFKQYNELDVLEEEISMAIDMNDDIEKWDRTVYLPYVNSMKSIIIESIDEILNYDERK